MALGRTSHVSVKRWKTTTKFANQNYMYSYPSTPHMVDPATPTSLSTVRLPQVLDVYNTAVACSAPRVLPPIILGPKHESGHTIHPSSLQFVLLFNSNGSYYSLFVIPFLFAMG